MNGCEYFWTGPNKQQWTKGINFGPDHLLL